MADLAGVNGQRTDFKIVGKLNIPGWLSWSLASGVAKFGADYVVPDMLHARYLRSPYANARIKSIDVSMGKGKTFKLKAFPGDTVPCPPRTVFRLKRFFRNACLQAEDTATGVSAKPSR